MSCDWKLESSAHRLISANHTTESNPESSVFIATVRKELLFACHVVDIGRGVVGESELSSA